MPLRFDLGPFEKLFIGKSVLTNGGSRTEFVVEGETPILRARDVLAPEQAANAMEKLYRCVQQMYLEENSEKYQQAYLALAARVISEYPTYHAELASADRLIKRGEHFKGLKELKKLIFPSRGNSDASLRSVGMRGHN